MKCWWGLVFAIAMALGSPCARADEPAATQMSATEVRLGTAIEKLLKANPSPTEPVLVVVRPGKDTQPERFAVRDLLRDAAVRQLHNNGVNVTASDEAAFALTQAGIDGVPTAADVQKLPLISPAGSILVLVIDRHDEARTVQITLVDPKHPTSPEKLQFTSDDFPPEPASLLGFRERDRCREVIHSAVEYCARDISAAAKKVQITRISMEILPALLVDARPGLEQEIADAVPAALHDFYFEHFTGTSNSTMPADQAVLTVKQVRRGSQRLVTFQLTSAHDTLWTGTVRIDAWDLADILDVPALNGRVVKYAETHRDQAVADGQCWSLCALALNDAGARFPEKFVFGRQLKPGEPVLPGDLIHFLNAHFESPDSSFTIGEPDHAAIVNRVLGDTRCEMWEQNPGTVRLFQVDFRYFKSGSYEIYRPEKKKD